MSLTFREWFAANEKKLRLPFNTISLEAAWDASRANGVVFSQPERDRLVKILDFCAGQHKAWANMSLTTDAEKVVLDIDSELLLRLAAMMRGE
jgi:hypothetical protein